jgi:hypothetical protein
MTPQVAIVNRTARVIAALQQRISEQGDMPIRVSRHTMRTLMKALGLGGWEVGADEFREVDALALDMLRHLAWLRIAA